MKTIALLYLSAVFGGSILSAETVTLIPSRDTDVYAFTGFPTSSITTLGVSTTPVSSTTLHSQKSLVEFDFTHLGMPAEEIGSAILRLFVFPTDPSWGTLQSGDVYVHIQGKAWSDNANWNSFDPKELLGVIPKDEIQEGVWVEIDVTQGARGWVSGAVPNHGLVLKSMEDRMTPGVNISFASMETAEDGLAPELVITRGQAAEPEPPVLAIAMSGGEIVLRWPQSGSEGWVLKWARDLSGPWETGNWQSTAEAGMWRVAMPAEHEKAFFRLEK